jgi:hypothetical protein
VWLGRTSHHTSSQHDSLEDPLSFIEALSLKRLRSAACNMYSTCAIRACTCRACSYIFDELEYSARKRETVCGLKELVYAALRYRLKHTLSEHAAVALVTIFNESQRIEQEYGKQVKRPRNTVVQAGVVARWDMPVRPLQRDTSVLNSVIQE